MLLALSPESAAAPQVSARSGAVRVERALYDAIRHGDERQAPQVYASLLPAVQATLLRVLGGPHRHHRELTRRSIEQVILELARHPSPWSCRLETWATTSAARVALEVLRARVQTRAVDVAWGDALAHPVANDSQPTPAGSAIDQLRWLLAELPQQQAEVVVLCDVMGLDANEVAVTLHVGVDHVRRLLSAGHERLARQMAGRATAPLDLPDCAGSSRTSG
jgi:DNA-directed RNA polymerase specialized sigma24 family protein